jgi:hypothetical protein
VGLLGQEARRRGGGSAHGSGDAWGRAAAAGAGKPDTRGYPPGAGTGKIFRPQVCSRAGTGRQHGYARGRVNALPARTRPATISTTHGLACLDQSPT